MAKPRKKKWSKKVWVGFCDGRPHYAMIDTGFGGWGNGWHRTIILFTDKERAKLEYEDVRPMILTEYDPTDRLHVGKRRW